MEFSQQESQSTQEAQGERLFDVAKVEAMLKEVKSLGDLTKPGGVIQEMMKSTVERILKAEQEHHLGYSAHEKNETGRRSNSRNGYSQKTLKTSAGDVQIDVPRDRNGSFEPQIVDFSSAKKSKHGVPGWATFLPVFGSLENF